MKFSLVILLTISLQLNAQSNIEVDSIDYTLLYKNLSGRIEKSLSEIEYKNKKESVLFSIRFNLDSSGSIVNLESSYLSPPLLVNSLAKILSANIDTSLKTRMNLINLRNKYLLIPIVISPPINTKSMGVNYPVNIDMIREMYNFSTKKSEKITYYWFPPFNAIIFTPVTFPYTYKLPYGDKFDKYYKAEK